MKTTRTWIVMMALVLTAALASQVFAQAPAAPAAPAAPTATAPAPLTPESVIASVEGVDLTKAQFDILKKFLAPGAPEAQDQRLIEFWKLSTVLGQQAKAAKMDSDPEVMLVVDMLKNKFLGDLYIRKLQADIVITDEEIQAYYDANKDKPEFRKGFFVTADIIAAEKREQIVATKKELTDGKKWEEVFAAHKTQTAKLTGLSDPAINNVASNLLVANLGQSVVNAMNMVKEGDIIGPRKASKAWVLFKVTSRTPGDLIPLADVKDSVKEKLLREKKMKMGRELMEAAQKKAGVTPPSRQPMPRPQRPAPPKKAPAPKPAPAK